MSGFFARAKRWMGSAFFAGNDGSKHSGAEFYYKVSRLHIFILLRSIHCALNSFASAELSKVTLKLYVLIH